MPKKSSGLSQSQRKTLFTTIREAARECGEQPEAYRKRIMAEELGVEHLSQVSATTGFDMLMARIRSDAGDFQAAGDAAEGDAKRKAYLVKVCAIQVMQLKGGDESLARDYLEGVVHQARIPCGVNTADNSWWMDVPPGSLDLVLRILDTERRRLLKQLMATFSLKLDDTVRFEVDGPIFSRMGVERGWYARQPFNVNLVERS